MVNRRYLVINAGTSILWAVLSLGKQPSKPRWPGRPGVARPPPRWSTQTQSLAGAAVSLSGAGIRFGAHKDQWLIELINDLHEQRGKAWADKLLPLAQFMTYQQIDRKQFVAPVRKIWLEQAKASKKKSKVQDQSMKDGLQTFNKLLYQSVIVQEDDLEVPGFKSFRDSNLSRKSKSSISPNSEQNARQLFKPSRHQKISKSELKALRIFVRFCNEIQLQLKMSSHPLAVLFEGLVEYMAEDESLQQDVDLLKQSVLGFASVLHLTLVLFYDVGLIFESEEEHQYFTFQNLTNQIISMLFKKEKVQQISKGAIFAQCSSADDQFLKKCKLEKNRNKLPADFGVPKEYCMPLSKFPYGQTVKGIVDTQEAKTPMGKLKAILNACETIPKTISDYVRDVENREEKIARLSSPNDSRRTERSRAISYTDLIKKKLRQEQIDADGMLSIVSYVAFCAGREGMRLQQELSLVETFVCPSFMNGMGGYYWSVLQGSFQHILNVL